jgi:hypothetical protein
MGAGAVSSASDAVHPPNALDHPGHGYSDIPQARYDAAFFTKAVEGYYAKGRGMGRAGLFAW